MGGRPLGARGARSRKWFSFQRKPLREIQPSLGGHCYCRQLPPGEGRARRPRTNTGAWRCIVAPGAGSGCLSRWRARDRDPDRGARNFLRKRTASEVRPSSTSARGAHTSRRVHSQKLPPAGPWGKRWPARGPTRRLWALRSACIFRSQLDGKPQRLSPHRASRTGLTWLWRLQQWLQRCCGPARPVPRRPQTPSSRLPWASRRFSELLAIERTVRRHRGGPAAAAA